MGLVEIEQATVGDSDAMDEVDSTHTTALDSFVPRQQIAERNLDGQVGQEARA